MMRNRYGLKILSPDEQHELEYFDGYISDEQLGRVHTFSLIKAARDGLLAKDSEEANRELEGFISSIEQGESITPRQFGLAAWLIESVIDTGKVPEGFPIKKRGRGQKINQTGPNFFLAQCVHIEREKGLKLELAVAKVADVMGYSEDKVRRNYEKVRSSSWQELNDSFLIGIVRKYRNPTKSD